MLKEEIPSGAYRVDWSEKRPETGNVQRNSLQ